MGLPPCASLMLPEPTQYRGGLSSRSSTTERPPRQESPDRPEARLRSTFGYSSRPLLRDLYFTLSAQSQAGKATVELVRRERSRRRPTHEPYDKNTPVAAPRAQRGGCRAPANTRALRQKYLYHGNSEANLAFSDRCCADGRSTVGRRMQRWSRQRSHPSTAGFDARDPDDDHGRATRIVAFDNRERSSRGALASRLDRRTRRWRPIRCR